jgi:hypothetical protein
MDSEPAPRQSTQPLRRELPVSDSNQGETRQRPLQVTIDRWRRLAQEIDDWAAALDSDSQREADARQRIGFICSREALALRACEDIDGLG